MILPTQEPAKRAPINLEHAELETLTKPQQVWSLLPHEQQQMIFRQIVRVCQSLLEPIPNHKQEISDE
jgi:hypothetical protein